MKGNFLKIFSFFCAFPSSADERACYGTDYGKQSEKEGINRFYAVSAVSESEKQYEEQKNVKSAGYCSAKKKVGAAVFERSGETARKGGKIYRGEAERKGGGMGIFKPKAQCGKKESQYGKGKKPRKDAEGGTDEQGNTSAFLFFC